MSIMRRLAFLAMILINVQEGNPYKILIFPAPVKSHLFPLVTIGEELLRTGNIVHFLLADKMNIEKSQLAQLTSSFKVERYGKAYTGAKITDYDTWLENVILAVLEGKLDVIRLWRNISDFADKEAHVLLDDNEQLMNRLDKEKFDMAVVDGSFVSKYVYLIPFRLGIPWVTYSDVLSHWIVRTPHLPSFVPSRLTGISTERMSFGERFVNTIFDVIFTTWVSRLFEPSEDIVKNYRAYGNFSTMDDLISQSLLFITTTDNILDYAKPAMPNIVYAAGLSAKPSDGSSLSSDFKIFMAGAKKGVILLSFGSIVSSFPREIAQKFISAFEILGSEYRIIFRINNKDNLMFPENIMISRWVPQNDILADPRVKLFITHCGNSGQYEAVYHGVPMIGFPIIGDEAYNAKRLVYKGFGIAMEIQKFTFEELYNNIMMILNDRSYKARVQIASEIIKSAKETSAEKAAYWIEHVIKFGGEHLRSAGTELSVLQYLMFDVLFVLIILLAAFVFIGWKIIHFITRMFCFRFTHAEKLAMKKNQ